MGVVTDGDEYLYSGYPACTRLKDITNTTIHPGAVSFYVRLTQPNDTWCNYTWWTPVVMPKQHIPYLIMEEGHFNMSGSEFDIKSNYFGTHCTGQNFRHFWYHRFTTGARPASIAQAQTFEDYRYMVFREVAYNNNATGVTLYVQLHGAMFKWAPRYGDCVAGHFDDHYDNNRWRQAYTMTAQRISVFSYSPQYIGNCTRQIVFETREINGITSDTRFLPYCWLYNTVPGVFGMVNSFTGGNAINIRSFNHTVRGVSVVLQEDQCDKQSNIHIQAEKLSFFVVGQANLRVANPFNPWNQEFCEHVVNGECYVDCPDCAEPTSEPTLQPTEVPTTKPSEVPNSEPTIHPTIEPTLLPVKQPSILPTIEPTLLPTKQPTRYPTIEPTLLPTKQPTILPTIEPTFLPTIHPTMWPTVEPSMVPIKPPTRQPTVGSTYAPICVMFVLVDKFGDGWSTAQFMVYDSCGQSATVQPTCTENPMVVPYCFDPNTAMEGDTVSGTVFGFRPKFPWEIIWQAVDTNSGKFYTGTFETTMVFKYSMCSRNGKLVPTIELWYGENVLPNYLDYWYVYSGACDNRFL